MIFFDINLRTKDGYIFIIRLVQRHIFWYEICITLFMRQVNRSAVKFFLTIQNHKVIVILFSAKRSFSYSCPFFWNSLPSFLTLTKSLTVFRKGLKTHLFVKFVSDLFCSPRKGRYKKLYWLIDWLSVRN